MEAATIGLLALISVWAIKRLSEYSKIRPPYPPGPKPKPFIGNLLDFPATSKEYVEWGKQYKSTILYAEVLGTRIVIVNSQQDAEELFESPTRARMYSDRPVIPIVPLMDCDYNISIMRYGEEWRQHRKICQNHFNAHAARNYESIQMAKVRQLLQGLLDTPKEFDIHNKMFSVSLTMSMMYGYEVESVQDPCVTMADLALTIGARLSVPGGSMLNVIPALRHIPAWLPGAPSYEGIKQVRALTHEVKRIPMEFVKKSFENGTVTPSLVTDFYERKYTVGATKEEEEMVKNVAFTVYGAASDTTISSTGTFFYAMAANPDVQKKAQAEIDLVIGTKRLPTLADRGSLPYIEAVYREVMRFNPPVPLSVPHCLSEDDYYKGYFIPKGDYFRYAPAAMTHDEEVYPEPFSFKPERFFDEQGNLNTNDRILAYSFGRRACVGKHVASSTMWLLIASILACYNIGKAKDGDGNDIEINAEFDEDGFLSHKRKFECSFVVRSLASQQLIEETN
ncbi:hypothetical protein CVT25_013779 [Psilocybe cyanescens]|uniref:Cytochrome P450 n=1 Tax=Psilocybe cyanescens TaxID=93625 RepID=A0A409WTY9_PSICY|nr:hypothetical protein CVT25_013779 [Psilocybe cyanescens]